MGYSEIFALWPKRIMWTTKNNTGGHLKIRGTRKNSNMMGHRKFLGGFKNRGGKAFREPVTEGCPETGDG